MYEEILIQYGAVGVIIMGMLGGIVYLFGDSKNLRNCLTKTKSRVAVIETKQDDTKNDIEEIKETQLRIFAKIDDIHNECLKFNRR